jgi:CRP/FNR family transcriptional regulator
MAPEELPRYHGWLYPKDMAMDPQVAEKVAAFFGDYPLKEFSKGEVMILADENPKYVYHLVEGHVREYDISYRGDQIVVNVFKPPAFFPMSWTLAKVPNRYFFEAGEKVKAHLAPVEDVYDFVKSDPDVANDLLVRLYTGIEGLQRRMAHLMGGSAKSRLLFELILECRRFGARRKDGSYIITISESEIGARAGLSRETVSRSLNELKRQNLISVSRPGIILKDLDALEIKLGADL